MPDMAALAGIIRRSALRAIPLAQAYSEGNMTSLVVIRRPQTKVFDRASGAMVNPDDVVVTDDCPAHIYTVDGGTQYTLGDEPVYYANTYASIPVSRPRPWVNDELEVLASADPDLVGRLFRISGMFTGGMIPAVHRAILTGVEPAPNVTL